MYHLHLEVVEPQVLHVHVCVPSPIYPGMCIYVSMHGICAHSYTCTYTIHTDLHTLYMYMYMYVYMYMYMYI